MHIEILTIGNEILNGSILNTNFTYLAQKLHGMGWGVQRHLTIGDHKQSIQEECAKALKDSDLVLLTGGLGPTVDDQTKQAMCQLFNTSCEVNEDVKQDLLKRYGENLSSLEQQSLVPKGAEILPNKVGTAPGFLFRQGEKMVIVLPGVPLEMKQMFNDHVIEKIEGHKKAVQKTIYKQWSLCHLTENEIDPFLNNLKDQYPSLQIGIYPGYGLLSVSLGLTSEDKKEILQECEKHFYKEFNSYIYSEKEEPISAAIQRLLISKKKSLGLAESCTGGAIAARITEQAGASDYFLGGVVAYSNFLKEKLLGVRAQTLETFGAVSQEVVEEMIGGALKYLGSDYALVTSGIAGPSGGSLEKPVGTVWCGLGIKGQKPYVWKILAKGRGKRESVIDYTTNYMLGALWRHLAFSIDPTI